MTVNKPKKKHHFGFYQIFTNPLSFTTFNTKIFLNNFKSKCHQGRISHGTVTRAMKSAHGGGQVGDQTNTGPPPRRVVSVSCVKPKVNVDESVRSIKSAAHSSSHEVSCSASS